MSLIQRDCSSDDVTDISYQFTAVHEICHKQAEITPNATAVVDDFERITYGELLTKSTRIASRLRDLGVGTDTVVALFTQNSAKMVIGILGILMAGGAYLPLDTNCPEQRLLFMLKNSGCNILLWDDTDQTAHAMTMFDEVSLVGLSQAEHAGAQSRLTQDNTVSPSDLAYIMYTSGTTGVPKGVMIEHKSVTNLIKGLKDTTYREIEPQRNIVLLSPFYFDASVETIFFALCYGHTLFIPPHETVADGERLFAYIQQKQIHFLFGAPAHLELLVASKMKRGDALFLQHVCMGGETLTANVLEGLFSMCYPAPPIVFNTYGPTECCVEATTHRITPGTAFDGTAPPLGKPLPNTRIYILDENMQPLLPGEKGQICIAGAGLARGYTGNPMLTEQSFRSIKINMPHRTIEERIYLTGDYGSLMSSGVLEFKGRIDGQVNIRGFRVELGEIESRLLCHPAIKNAAVVVEDRESNEYIAAYFTAETSNAHDTVRQYLLCHLPAYMMPARLIQLDAMPLNPNGKVDRSQLEACASEQNFTNDWCDNLLTPQQRKVISVWCEAVGFVDWNLHDSFFNMGGNSLILMKFANMLDQKTNATIAPTTIIRYNTIASLAKYLDDIENKA